MVEFQNAEHNDEGVPRSHPVAKRWACSQSHTWKRMMEIKEVANHLYSGGYGLGMSPFGGIIGQVWGH